MLSNARAAAVVAVADYEQAQTFYGGTLGLQMDGEEPGAAVYSCGAGTRLLVYASSYAGTNKATAVSFDVDDLEGEIAELKQRGVSFEQYDIPGGTREGDVHVTGNVRAAWFTDPEGNILALVSRS